MSIFNHSFTIAEEQSGNVSESTSRAGRLPFVQAFKNFSLSAKLRLVVFGAAIVPFVVVAVMLAQFVYFGNAGADHAQRVAAEIKIGQAALAISQVDGALARARQQQSEAMIQSAAGGIAKTRDDLDEAIELAQGRYPNAIVLNLKKARDQVNAKSIAIERLTLSSSPQAFARLRGQARQCAIDLDSIFASATRHAKQVIADMLYSIATAITICVVLIIAAILISVLGARAMIAHMVGQITQITSAMEKVASGDVKTPIPGSERSDEIGAMARSLMVFRSSLLELRELTNSRARDAETQLAQQQLVAQQMRDLRSEKSQLLEGLADVFEVSVGDLINAVSTASHQLKSTSQRMVELAAGSSEQASEASEAMQSSTMNVTAAAASTDEFALSIGEISRQASASAELARGASDQVGAANTKMTDLTQAAIEVGAIVELIQTIAQRTNLLALNASIEAARGGEAGRGFAVVASEVKELAMQTSNAANSVTDKISAMQSSAQSSAGDLEDIVNRIGELEQTAVMIASAVDQQSISATDLAKNIDSLAYDSGQVSTRLGVLRSASEETGTAADEVVGGAQALGTHTDELRIKAADFIQGVRRSARDLEAGDAGLEDGLERALEAG